MAAQRIPAPPLGSPARAAAQGRPWQAAAPLIGLLAAAAALTLTTVYRGFLTEDAAMYGLGLLRLDREGLAALPEVFNGELSFGYYLLHLGLYRLYGAPLALATVLAVANALFAVGAVAAVYGLVQRWFGAVSAFFAALLLLLAPGFWQLSRYGHPSLPALAFFLASLAALDQLITDGFQSGGRLRHCEGPQPRSNPSPGAEIASSYRPRNDGPQRETRPLISAGEAPARLAGLAAAFVVLVVVALALRADTLLLAPVYLGLLIWRGQAGRGRILALAGLLLAALLAYEGLRLALLGYALNPSGGTVLLHLGRTAQHWGELGRSLLKNLTLWTLGVNPVVAACALWALAVLLRRRDTRLAVFALCWLAPIACLAPFHALDFSRIATLATPAVALLAALLPAQLKLRHPGRALAALVIAAQLAALLAQPVVVRVYPPRMVYEGRRLATVPLGLTLADTLAKQRYLEARDRIVRAVVAVRDRDVAVLGSSNLMPYRFYLAVERDAVDEERTALADIPLGIVAAGGNRFYLFDAGDCPGCSLTGLLDSLAGRGAGLHVVPFDSRFAAQGLFLTRDEIAALAAAGL